MVDGYRPQQSLIGEWDPDVFFSRVARLGVLYKTCGRPWLSKNCVLERRRICRVFDDSVRESILIFVAFDGAI